MHRLSHEILDRAKSLCRKTIFEVNVLAAAKKYTLYKAVSTDERYTEQDRLKVGVEAEIFLTILEAFIYSGICTEYNPTENLTLENLGLS